MVSTSDHYVFNYEDLGEVERMKWQHKVLVKMEGGLFPTGLNSSEVKTVADIATGTGDWLNDVAEQLAIQSDEDKQPRLLHGFDINSTVFAPNPQRSPSITIEHTVHDMTKPFPENLHGKFQLVHVRFTFAFLKQSKVKDTLQNVAALASPGGFIVWTEVNLPKSTVTDPENPKHMELIHYGQDFFAKVGSCRDLCGELEKAAIELDLPLREKREARGLDVLDLGTVQRWEELVWTNFLPNALPVIMPEKKDECPAMVERMLANLKEIHRQGHVRNTAVMKLVFQKGEIDLYSF